MLIEPASKVSVPLTVVMRRRSNVPDVVLEPFVAIQRATAVATQIIPRLVEASDQFIFIVYAIGPRAIVPFVAAPVPRILIPVVLMSF